ncbi:glycosyltransferase [Streptococcus sp. A22]|uniref:glycosyltransferase n=1 Tax=Streptococcus sp. A22 TaxID=3373126 RepID=UPI00374D0D5F
MYEEDLKESFHVRSFPFWNDKYVSTYMHRKKIYIFHIVLLYIISLWKRIFQVIFFSTKFDVIIIQKAMIPWSNINFINFFKSKGKKVIFDIDDAVYLNKVDHSPLIAKKVDTVVVGNKNLANYYKDYNDNILIFPTVDYSPEYEKYRKNTFQTKVIGWIGSDTTIPNLELVESAITKLIKKHPEVSFKIITNKNSKFNFSGKRNFHHIAWDINTYKEELSDITVGIMPLFDTEFNRGKCAFKLIQYLTMGKPVVASPVGINTDVVGNAGLLATNEQEWFLNLESLLFDENKYKSALISINDEFDKTYNYEVVLDNWIKLIKEI